VNEPEPLAPVEEAAQGEPLARVQGEPLLELPKDLYIPPEALEVVLEAFEGPLDLLLYLIRRQNLDILDIPIAEITRQYMEYVELMRELRLELAAEYLVMAAMLAEIKSRMLLPRPAAAEEEEEDPRAELIRRLREYEQFRQAAGDLDALPRVGRDLFPLRVRPPEDHRPPPRPRVELGDLLGALQEVLRRARLQEHHHVQREGLSVRERMTRVLDRVAEAKEGVAFTSLFTVEEGRRGVVVTFLALLELLKLGLLELIQSAPFEPIHVRAAAGDGRA
jgi:segregation and condensation protein A